MKGLLGRLCGSKNSELTVPDSPLRGAGRRQVGDVGAGDMETSHVRFQDSDLGGVDFVIFPSTMSLIIIFIQHVFRNFQNNDFNIHFVDEIEVFDDRVKNMKLNQEKNNNYRDPPPELSTNVIEEDGEEDSEDVYSKVFEGHEMKHENDSNISTRNAPKPAVRRKKRKERDESYKSNSKCPTHVTNSKHVSFDWLSGAHVTSAGRGSGGEGGGANSQIAVLKNMVYKLSVELGKEQSKRKDTGVQLEDVTEAPWLAQVGGLVPLLVAYEEEIKELKQSRGELEEVVEKNKERLEELLHDNTEMATQLHNIAKVGPVDFEEFRVIRESAALVLEENSLLKESQEAIASKIEKLREDSEARLSIADEDINTLKKENARLSARNKNLEEEAEQFRKFEEQIRQELTKSIHIDTHSKAVEECQTAFEELKQNYDKENEEKHKTIQQLKKELSEANFNVERLNSTNIEIETELKISKKMMTKYEELCLSLQDKLLIIAKNRAEAEEFARKCEEEAETAKLEAEALTKLAKQHRAAERAADKERDEESFVLEKLQQRMKELKISMGGRIKQLELELKKSEANKNILRDRLEQELKNTRKELELQRRIAEKYREQ